VVSHAAVSGWFGNTHTARTDCRAGRAAHERFKDRGHLINLFQPTQVGVWIEDQCNRRGRHASFGQVTPVAFELHFSRQIADSQEVA